MFGLVEQVSSTSETAPRERVSSRRAADDKAFDAMLSAMAGGGYVDRGGGEAEMQSMARVTRRAQANLRITDEESPQGDKEVDQRDDDLDSEQHMLQQGAVAVALAELGLGELASVLNPSHADAVKLQEQGKAQANPKEDRSLNDETAQERQVMNRKPNESKGHAQRFVRGEVKPFASKVDQLLTSPSRTIKAQMTAQSVRSSMPAPETVVREAASRAFDVKPNKAMSQPSQTQVVMKAMSSLQQTNSSPSKGDGQSDAGLNLRDSQAKNELAKSSVKSNHAESLPKEVQNRTVNDVLRVLQSNLGRQHSVVKLQLSPPELGKLTIDLRMDGDALRVRIEAESEAVRELLKDNSSMLRDALHEQGVSVERYEVHLNEAPSSPVDFERELAANDSQSDFLTDSPSEDSESDNAGEGLASSIGDMPEENEHDGNFVSERHIDVKI